MMKKFMLAGVISLCCALLAGCNTVHGVGKDIESGGKAIEKASGKSNQQ
ncbi:MAG: entericidin A/B family lipoprotein [Thermodesulfovibrionales bacterium]